MKSYVQWLMHSYLLIVFPGCSLIQQKPVEENTDKAVSFAIYKGYKYNAKVYDCTYVQVHIMIEKVGQNSSTPVWDTTFTAKLLKQFPTLEKRLLQTVIVPDVSDNKEHLQVRYIITYDSKGSRLEMQNEMIMQNGTESFEISI